MSIYSRLIALIWLALIVYWVLAAFRTRRDTINRLHWRGLLGRRLTLLAFVLLALRLSHQHPFRHFRLPAVSTHPAVELAGLALCIVGAGVAIWARVCLGRNWGPPMTRRTKPELITSGPYARIRHPIYTGFMLLLLGSAIGQNVVWAIPLVLLGSYFVYSAHREERFMMTQLPQQYPAYMKRTWRFIPLVY